MFCLCLTPYLLLHSVSAWSCSATSARLCSTNEFITSLKGCCRCSSLSFNTLESFLSQISSSSFKCLISPSMSSNVTWDAAFRSAGSGSGNLQLTVPAFYRREERTKLVCKKLIKNLLSQSNLGRKVHAVGSFTCHCSGNAKTGPGRQWKLSLVMQYPFSYRAHQLQCIQ